MSFKKPCLTRGCRELAPSGQSRCVEHQAQLDRAHNRDRNAKRGSTPVAAAARRELKRVGHGVCYVCGATRVAGELRIDHVVPLADNGLDVGSNVRPICHRPCHVEKSRQEAIERAKRRKQ